MPWVLAGTLNRLIRYCPSRSSCRCWSHLGTMISGTGSSIATESVAGPGSQRCSTSAPAGVKAKQLVLSKQPGPASEKLRRTLDREVVSYAWRIHPLKINHRSSLAQATLLQIVDFHREVPDVAAQTASKGISVA